MSTESESFEAAFSEIWGRPPGKWEGEYVYSTNEWKLWQAARSSAVPCAAVADEVQRVMDETMLTNVTVGDGSMGLELQGGAATMFAEMAVSQFQQSGATNFVEVAFSAPEILPGEEFVMTVQRRNGLTPAQKLKAANARIAELEATPATVKDSSTVDVADDAAMLDWLERKLFGSAWGGTIGRPKDWRVLGDYRHTTQRMVGNTFREAIRAAMKADTP